MKKKGRKVSKSLYWTPRILAIIFIAFISLFSLDVFEKGYTFWQTVLGLFMHNIPSLVLLIVLIVSWKYEIVGGIAFIFAGILYIFLTALRQPWYILLSWSMMIALPAFIIGILFFVNWIKKKH